MNFSRSDFAQLKWSMLAFMLSMLLGGGALWLVAGYESAALQARQAAQKQVDDARAKLAATQTDLENMSSYATEYAALVSHKIVGGEQRLDWVEELEKLRRQHYVLDFKYAITPQQLYTPVPALDTGDLEIKLSGVNLKIDLLHEMQLIKFFEALRADRQGWFVIDHCALERVVVQTDEMPLTSNAGAQLKADCAGGWITLNHRSAQ